MAILSQGGSMSIVRIVNYILLSPLLLALNILKDDEPFSIILNGYTTFFYLIGLFLIVYGVIQTARVNFAFDEWDKIERRKKTTFFDRLYIVTIFFTNTGLLFLTTGVTELWNLLFKNIGVNDNLELACCLFFGILLIINALFSVKLHPFIYENSIEQSRFRTRKPENWDD